ncbi:MAG: ATP-binding cassette domain-containing protein [Chloroflexi bacterium]|nr:MAG: ABC transporter ATP-binding protein [Phototrophicales bacterium]RMF79681.1 MAG: ATP-binding cassette domain-containing protein [Chloroflexota bacterium]
MGEPFVQVRNLVKIYETPTRRLEVLRGVNLELYPGDFAAIVGPSGSGKSTLLNMITGIDKPTAGEVIVGDMNITATKQRHLTKWRSRNIGIAYQFFQLLPTLSVIDNVMAPMDFGNVGRKNQRRERAMQLLEFFGIQDQSYKTPDMLSGGQQQRLSIARALANNPALLIGDEPTGNLDRMSAEQVFRVFRSYAEYGTTVLIVTHDRHLVRDVPIIYALNNGILERTTVDEIEKRRTQEIKRATQEWHTVQSQEVLQ